MTGDGKHLLLREYVQEKVSQDDVVTSPMGENILALEGHTRRKPAASNPPPCSGEHRSRGVDDGYAGAAAGGEDGFRPAPSSSRQ